MTDEPTTREETHEPSEFGGDPSVPEPVPEHRDRVDGESIAVPAGEPPSGTVGQCRQARVVR